jgi:conjugal transfer pilus assembly protein TraD
VFRIGNPETRKRISEHFGEVMIKTVVRSQSNSTSSDDPTKFSGSASESEEEERLPLVPQEVLGKIPTLEYFAWNAGGRIVKGRLPILEKHAVALPAGAGASPTQGAHG